MSDFGASLRAARERRGVSLRQIAANTKISVAALEALERNDVSKLPGGIFSRAFVRSYALEVGLNPDETVREFLARFQPVQTTVTTGAAVPAEDESRRQVADVVRRLLFISLPVAGLVLYFTLRSPSVSHPPVAASPPVVEPRGPEARGGSPVAGTVSQPVPPVVAPAAPSNTPASAGLLTLEVRPIGDCWVRVTVDGRTALSRVMHAGETESLTARETAVIDVGDAGAFAYSINGRPGKPLGQTGQVRTARITTSTVGQFQQ